MTGTIAPLVSSSLREQAGRMLKASIITGDIEAGRLYSVGEFAERFGVSATPVREALGDLAGVGLVEIIRNRGFVVPELKEHDLDEIFELRLMLEVPAVVSVTGQLGQADLKASWKLVREGKKLADRSDLAGFLETDRAFHLGLLKPLGNGRLVDIVDRLRDQARLYGLRSLAASGHLLAFAEEHEALLRAIEAPDVQAAREEMTRHLKHTRGAWAGHEEPRST